jgi:predicted nucleic acid-binding protein
LTTFLDTSAILALFDADDPRHPGVDSVWKELILSEEPLVSSNYILVETLALVQRRLGMDAVQAVQRDIVSSFEVMRRRGIARALAVDGHFDEHGFQQIPR